MNCWWRQNVAAIFFSGLFNPSSMESESQAPICSGNDMYTATLRQKLQIKLAVSTRGSILTLDQPIQAFTLWHEAPGSDYQLLSHRKDLTGFVCLLVGCLTSQQHASISQGRFCTDSSTCCHTEIEVADQTFYLTQSQYTDTGPISPSADPILPGAWQGSYWSANIWVTGMTWPRKKSQRKWDSNPGSSVLEADALPLGQRGGHLTGESGLWHPCVWLFQATRPTRRLQIMLSGAA